MIQATLCFLLDDRDEPKVLLGRKKRGFGEGKLNGLGGKLSPGETPDAAVRREVHEEVGVDLDASLLHSAGTLTFHFPFHPPYDHFVHLYVATRWTGEPHASEEMDPCWVAVAEIPYAKMWQDDAYWLPIVLRGQTVHGEFTFGQDNETVTAWWLRGAEPPHWKGASYERG